MTPFEISSDEMVLVSPEVRTVAPEAATSRMVFMPGWLAGSHMSICGLMVICEVTAIVGCAAAVVIAWSVLTAPRVIASSRYMSAGTVWKPVLGPPERTSMSTPVSTPWATSEPFTELVLVSTVLSGPTRAYIAPCSASGCQSCCCDRGRAAGPREVERAPGRGGGGRRGGASPRGGGGARGGRGAAAPAAGGQHQHGADGQREPHA